MPVNLPRLVTPRFYVVNPSTGRPVSLGEVRFYLPGTTTAKEVYADAGAVTGLGNEVTLDAAGSCEVFLSGSYRIEVYDAAGAELFTADNLNSIPVETEEGNPGSLIANQNLADLTDKAAARAVLGLVKPTGASDATQGNVMLVGTLGYGGTAPAPTTSPLDFNGMVDVGRFGLGSVVGIANPPGVDAGILDVIKRATDRIVQAFYTTGSSVGGGMKLRARIASGWTRWVEVFTQANAVGTVSQLDGLPTGALVESGQTADGRFWKYADGLMICRTSAFSATKAIDQAFMGMFRSTATAVVFPAQFLTGTVPSVIPVALGLTCTGLQADAATATGFNCYFLANSSQASASRSGSYIAIGRWF